MGGWFFLALIIGLALFAISIYNRLVAGRNRFKNAFAQIDVQLTRRHDLIPNLVETAKGYMAHERETLEAVINARASATKMTIDPSNSTPEQIQAYQQAQGGLSQALGRLMVVAERYPDLKADRNFR